MAEQIDLSAFVKHGDDGTAHMDFAVDGITCAACIGTIEGALEEIAGLAHARVNYSRHRLTVDWVNDTTADPARIVAALARHGYRAYPFSHDDAEDADARHARWLLRCLAVAGFAAMNVMLLSVSVWAGSVSDITAQTRDFFHWLSALIVLPAAAFAGQPFFFSAWRALRGRSLNMDVPISLGIALALGMSVVETAHHAEHAYFDSAIMLIFFLLIGRYLDQAMRRRTRASAANLAAMRAPIASRIAADGEITGVPVHTLAPGDLVLVRPGERVPVDGTVVAGTSDVDESLITGETTARATSADAPIYAGTLNGGGALQVSVRAAAGATLLDEIERLVEAAVAGKSRYRRLADRVARLYAPAVHLAALLTAIGWLLAGASLHDALVTAIAVLIVTCPCALALAVPAVQVVASGALFRLGVLLNAADAIERLAGVDAVVFDKTGTLTLPEPHVVNGDTIPLALRQQAGRLALSSHHPLAMVLAAREQMHAPFDDVQEIPGSGVTACIDGVEARLGSPVFCELEREAAAARLADPEASLIGFRRGAETAIFHVRQSLRADAVVTIEELRRKGLAITILSGDRASAVEPIACALGVSEWHGDLKPADKISFLKRLKASGCRTLMVGDGVNDAPALAAADVSLSPIGAADIAKAAADAVFLGARLGPVAEAIGISRAAFAIMKQNLALAVVYNAVAVPLAVAGHVTPLVAAAAMSGSSLLVTLNALRAGGRRRPSGTVTRPLAAKPRPAVAVVP